MSADGFDPYMELLDGRGNVLDVDDNSGDGAAARLTTSVDAGTPCGIFTRHIVALKVSAGENRQKATHLCSRKPKSI